jgi:hypothetical protein
MAASRPYLNHPQAATTSSSDPRQAATMPVKMGIRSDLSRTSPPSLAGSSRATVPSKERARVRPARLDPAFHVDRVEAHKITRVTAHR